MNKRYCDNCKMWFNTNKEKSFHKKEFPDGSCEGKFTEEQVMASERDKPLDESIPQVESISMTKEEAKKELKVYRNLLKTRHESYLKQMKDSLVQLSKGRKIINILEVMQKAGVGEDRLPKLAIAKADGRKVYLYRAEKGRASFSLNSSSWSQNKKDTLFLPSDTFPEWIRTENEKFSFVIYEALIPIVPAILLPEGALSNYWILWEVEKWSKNNPVPPRDPILLKRINETTFAVLSAWDLTPLERTIIGGRK